MLRENVQELIERWQREHGDLPWKKSERIVVGVSGGPDSMALLHVFVYSGLHPAKNLVVGHLNHRLRAESGDEADYVAALCKNWGVECHVESADVQRLAEEEQLSLEEAARHARYHFLAEVAHRRNAACVAVGHTADDQVETVLMHFVRGSGLAGLRGMLPVGPLPQARDLRLLRPFLTTTREEIEAYCRENELRPVQDPSNRESTFFRNRLRNELLPLLAQYNPAIRERILHTATVVRGDHALLVEMTGQAWEEIILERGEGWLRVDLQGWQGLPLSLRRRTLRHAVWELRASLRDVPFDAVEQARHVAEDAQVGAQSTLPAGVVMRIGYDSWVLGVKGASIPRRAPQIYIDQPVALTVPGKVSLERGWEIHADYVDLARSGKNLREDDRWRAHVDASVADNLLVRNRLPGERFRPLGLGKHSMKIADFMINEKLPARLRGAWPIVATAKHAVWIVGYQIDERARVRTRDNRAVELRCVRA